MASLPEPLLRALRDPAAKPRAADAGAHAMALLRRHVLGTIDAALSQAGIDALVVKGAALALTVYPSEAVRPMNDIDLLVRAEDRDRALLALRAAGIADPEADKREASADLLGEVVLIARSGAAELTVELHTSIDKIAPRPLATRDLLARSAPLAGLSRLRAPSLEDHALIVALHASTHGFRHPIALLDLELILRAGIDESALADRARRAELATALWIALTALRRAGAASVSDALLERIAPGRARRAIAERWFIPLATSRPDGAGPLGAPWILEQTALRDDPWTWASGVARYAWQRARERRERARAASRGRDPVNDPLQNYRVPRWVRAVIAADRATMRLENLRDGLRDELLLAWVPAEERGALTAALYAEQSTYLPGGGRFQRGLFSWEKRLFDDPRFPRRGRVLVGAAGAGREVVALLDRGYEVTAFDPCAPFVEAASSVAAGATFLRASYDDLIDAAAGRGGPLATIARRDFDAVVLGWGSLSHVAPEAQRAALLRAVTTVAPRAVVVASFALEEEHAARTPGRGRVRTALRRVFEALGAPGTLERGDHFYSNGGFLTSLTADEITRSAWAAGLAVAELEESPYPHALLTPIRESSSAA